MSEEDFLQALSGVDAQLSSHTNWQELKGIASDHPWSLGETPLTAGQQCVLAFWRILCKEEPRKLASSAISRRTSKLGPDQHGSGP